MLTTKEGKKKELFESIVNRRICDYTSVQVGFAILHFKLLA